MLVSMFLMEDLWSNHSQNHEKKPIFDVFLVGGVHRFPPKGKEISKGWEGARQAALSYHLGVTPSVLRSRYNLTAKDVGTATNNSQAVAQVHLIFTVEMSLKMFIS